jgi:hypothetical protein
LGSTWAMPPPPSNPEKFDESFRFVSYFLFER